MNFYTFFDLIVLKLLTARDNFKLVGFFFSMLKKNRNYQINVKVIDTEFFNLYKRVYIKQIKVGKNYKFQYLRFPDECFWL